MASIVYCDRVRHIVQESRMDIERSIWHAQQPPPAIPECECDSTKHSVCQCPPIDEHPHGYIYVTPESAPPESPGNAQIALKASAITSYQAFPGDGI